jgi:hypothetical protein
MPREIRHSLRLLNEKATPAARITKVWPVALELLLLGRQRWLSGERLHLVENGS